MKKLFLFITALFLASAASLSALEVYKGELQSAGTTDTVVFINYTGPHAKIDSVGSIKGIGSDIGGAVAKDVSRAGTQGTARYSVIHAVDPAQKDKLDADIFIIGSSATVDHIDNVRRIIAAYLSSAYGYSEKDAETIAVFVTVYNAVYRGKISDFQNKYKKIVTDNLTEKVCGLSVNYKDWPGNTQIVIPLYDVNNGGLSTVDTSVISDSQVVKHMQEDDDKNVESRKDMVDIKEREADAATEKAQDAQKTAVQEQKKLNEEKAKTEEAKAQADEAQKAADEAQKTADEAKAEAEAHPEDEALQQEAEEKQAEADQKQAEADEKHEEYAEQQEAEAEQQQRAEEAREEAAEQQSVADRKTSEAQSERKEIARDQQEVIRQEIANANAPSAFAIQLVDESSMLSGLVKVNTSTGEIIKSSPVRYIRNRTMFQSGENFVAIAGENSGNGAVKLVLLSPDTMEIIQESAESVAEDSVLVQDNGEYYCIVQDGGNFVLAKYDASLNLKLKSEVAVKAATPVTISAQNIILSGADGSVKVLGKSDFKEVSAK